MGSIFLSALEKLASSYPQLWEELSGEAVVKTARETPAMKERIPKLKPIRGKGRKGKKFIHKAIRKPGALRRYYGVKKGETIPVKKLLQDQKKLRAKENKSPAETKLLRRINLALTLRRLPRRGGGRGKKASVGLRNGLRGFELGCIKIAHEQPERASEMLLLMSKMASFGSVSEEKRGTVSGYKYASTYRGYVKGKKEERGKTPQEGGMGSSRLWSKRFQNETHG